MNWENLERDLERASASVYTYLEEPDDYDHLNEMHAALKAWPGLKVILELLIGENRRLNKEV